MIAQATDTQRRPRIIQEVLGDPAVREYHRTTSCAQVYKMLQVLVALSVFLFLLLCTRKSPGKGVNPTAEMVITEDDDGGTFGDIPAKRIVRAPSIEHQDGEEERAWPFSVSFWKESQSGRAGRL